MIHLAKYCILTFLTRFYWFVFAPKLVLEVRWVSIVISLSVIVERSSGHVEPTAVSDGKVPAKPVAYERGVRFYGSCRSGPQDDAPRDEAE